MPARLYSVRYDAALACRELSASDAKLAALIERAGSFGLQIQGSHSPFEALLEAVVYQQLHGKAAATILGRLLANFDGARPDPQGLLALSDEDLRTAGLSRNKALALKDLAQKTLEGTIPSLAQIRRLSDAEVIRRLTEVRGVGAWTAEMLLMFRLGRPDVLPVTDYGVRKGFLLTFGKKPGNRPITPEMLPKADEMLRRAKRWTPWRSVASWYLWRACDLDKRTWNKKTGAKNPRAKGSAAKECARGNPERKI